MTITSTTSGRVLLGHSDAGEAVHYVARSGPVVFHGPVTGGAGAGKSTAVRAVTAGLEAPGGWDVSTVVCDARGGLDEVDDAGERAEELLEQAEARIRAGREACPAQLLVFDGLHRLVRDERAAPYRFIERMERMTEIGPDHGLALLVTTKSVLVGDFGCSTALRARLASHNLIALRSHDPSNDWVIDGVQVQPNRLPGGGGDAVTVLGAQLVQWRVDWPGGEHDERAAHFNSALRAQRSAVTSSGSVRPT